MNEQKVINSNIEKLIKNIVAIQFALNKQNKADKMDKINVLNLIYLTIRDEFLK